MEFKHENIYKDLDYKDQVVNNNKRYVDDFINIFSKPILQYVGENILKVTPVELYNLENKTCYKDYSIPLVGEYYLFIAAKFLDVIDSDGSPNTTPQWNALRLYSAENNSTLYNYVNLITIRHFCKKPYQEESTLSNVDAFDYLANLFYDQDISYVDLKEEIKNDLLSVLNDMRKTKPLAKSDGERDARILELCVMYEYDWIDVTEEMAEYFNYPVPEQLRDLPNIDKKKIQTRIAQWKKRAIEHLSSMVIKSDKYNHLKGAILQHKLNRKMHRL